MKRQLIIGTLAHFSIGILLVNKSHQILDEAETDRRTAAIKERQAVFRQSKIADYCCNS